MFTAIAATTLGGCNTMPFKRAAYQALRQNDCHANELDGYCDRTYAIEFHEYDRLRRDFIRESVEPAWREHRTAWR